MMTLSDANPAPRLLKKRMRHTRLFALLLLPVVLFGLGWASDEGPLHETLDWLGYVLVIICVLGRGYCSAYIGGRKNDEVIADGPFAVVRNPLYVFSFIGIAGIGLQSGMVTLLVLLVVAFMLYYPRVVAHEEAFLLHKFGEAYRAYMREVPRWLPRLSRWREPQELTIKPRFLRETLMDASLFFLPLPCFELLEMLHEKGLVPVYFMLP